MLQNFQNIGSSLKNTLRPILNLFLGKLVIVYLDDILIYSKTYLEHVMHVQASVRNLVGEEALGKPREEPLFQQELVYLGHIILEKGVRMDHRR